MPAGDNGREQQAPRSPRSPFALLQPTPEAGHREEDHSNITAVTHSDAESERPEEAANGVVAQGHGPSHAQRAEAQPASAGPEPYESAPQAPTSHMRIRQLLRRGLTTILLAVGCGLALVPATPLLNRFLPGLPVPQGWLQDELKPTTTAALWACLGMLCAVALHLWVIRDMRSTRPLAPSVRGVSWLDVTALLVPLIVWVALRQKDEDSMILPFAEYLRPYIAMLLVGTALMAIALLLLPDRPWPPAARRGRAGQDSGEAGATHGRRRRAGAACLRPVLSLGLVVALTAGATGTGLYVVQRWRTKESITLSHPSDQGPIIHSYGAHDGQLWSTEISNSHSPTPWVVPTGHGPVILWGSDLEDGSSLVATALDASDGTARWQLDFTGLYPPTDRSGSPQPPGWAVTDPDGRVLALRLVYIDASTGEDMSRILVIDTETGSLTRDISLDGTVAQVALTVDALAVHIIDSTGPQPYGRILTFGATDHGARDSDNTPERTIETGNWLVGATRTSLLISDHYEPHLEDFSSTVTQIDPRTGAAQASTDNVYRVHPGGWVERFSSSPVRPHGDKSSDSWTTLDRELVDLDSGAALNLEGAFTQRTYDATGHLLHVRRDEPADPSEPEEGDTDGRESKTIGVLDISLPAGQRPVLDTTLPPVELSLDTESSTITLGTKEDS